MRRLGVLVALLALAAPARADDVDPEIIKATAGWWFLADAYTGKGCNLKLTTEDAIGGHAVEVATPCMVGTINGDDIAAWNFAAGKMILIDPLRHVQFHLEEQEYGAWTEDSADASAVLTPSAEGIAGLPVARRLFGTWNLARPDAAPLCTVALGDQPPPGGEESFAVTVAAGCDPAVRNLDLTSWRIEGVYVVLYGTGGKSLTFQADGSDGFAKTAKEGGKPLRMTRAP